MSTCCRFLKDEWKYLDQDDDYSSDLPISEKVWRNLPRRISDSDIQVSLSTFLVPLIRLKSDYFETLVIIFSYDVLFVQPGSAAEEWFRLWSVCSLLHQTVHRRSTTKAEKERPWHGELSSNPLPNSKITYFLTLFINSCVCLNSIQFDKKWFRPDEASALRIKIRNTLIDLFRDSN